MLAFSALTRDPTKLLWQDLSQNVHPDISTCATLNIKRKQFNITCLQQNVVAYVLKEWKCYNPEKLTNLMICGLLLITTWRNRALIYLPNKQKGVNTEQGECTSNFFWKIWLSYFILSSNGNPWVTLLARKKLIKPPKCTLLLLYFHRLFWPSSFWAGFSKY